MAKKAATRGKATASRAGKSTGARAGATKRRSPGTKGKAAASKVAAKGAARKGAASSASAARGGKRDAGARGKSTSPARATRTATPGKSARAAGKRAEPARSAKGAAGKGTTSVRGAKSGKGAAKRGKIGSSRRAAVTYAQKNDFGVPEDRAIPRGRDKTSASGLPRNEEGRSGAAGDRTHGVGSAPAGPGSGSGGDLDADIIGLDGAGGIAQNPASGDTSGPDASTGSSDEFASGGHARGENAIKPGTHGAFSNRVFDTVDHSGEDASTVQGGVSADSAGTAAGTQREANDVGSEIADAGELSSGEAGGQDSR